MIWLGEWSGGERELLRDKRSNLLSTEVLSATQVLSDNYFFMLLYNI